MMILPISSSSLKLMCMIRRNISGSVPAKSTIDSMNEHCLEGANGLILNNINSCQYNPIGRYLVSDSEPIISKHHEKINYADFHSSPFAAVCTVDGYVWPERRRHDLFTRCK